MATGQAVVEQEEVGLWFWCYNCEIAWPDDIKRGQSCPMCSFNDQTSSYYDNNWHEPEKVATV